MKKTLFIASAIVAGLLVISCNKNVNEGPSKPATVEVTISSDATKVTGITSNDPTTEAKVNKLEVLIFNGSELDGRGVVSTGAKTLNVNCTSGTRDVYCIVNGPDLSGVTTKAGLNAAVATLGTGQNDFTMFSFTDGEARVLNDGASINVNVKRFAARVVLHALKNGQLNATDAASFTLDAVYLTNVAGDVDFALSGGYAVASWYNRQGYESANSLGANDYDAVGAAIAADATNSTGHFFYSMPNANAPAVGGSWSPRRAKLVIKATINGAPYWYPITLPALQSNKSYEISLLTLAHKGNPSTDPDKEENPIDPASAITLGITMIVVDWDVVLMNGDGNIVL